jgi:hypothetical protein
MATLAAVFYYVERSLQFSKQTFPIALNHNMPLKIKINSPETSFSRSETTLNYDLLDSLRIINYPVLNDIEIGLDKLFYEFGHFLVFEIFRGTDPLQRSLNQDYVDAAPADNPEATRLSCHHGYAQLDSSCAISEGKAHFFGAMLQDRTLNLNHAYYRELAASYNNEGVVRYNFEDPFNIAGDKLLKQKKPPFFQHNDLAEENAIASLLWDLYDNTPSEKLGPSLGRELSNLNLNDLINSLIFAKTTKEYYLNLIAVIPKDKRIFDAVFANHGICIDSNKNGLCKRSEVIDGLSAWIVSYEGREFGYAYPPGRP